MRRAGLLLEGDENTCTRVFQSGGGSYSTLAPASPLRKLSGKKWLPFDLALLVRQQKKIGLDWGHRAHRTQ